MAEQRISDERLRAVSNVLNLTAMAGTLDVTLIARDLLAARELLQKIEWAADCHGDQACPSCLAIRGVDPHESDCRLAALIGR